MKSIYNNINRVMVMAALAFITFGCDLELQEDFVWDPEIPELATFEDQTVLDWMSALPPGHYDSLLVAIEHAGMEDFYTSNTDPHTFILLTNRAFRDGGEILSYFKVKAVKDVPMESMQTVLKYHIINEFVDQGPILPVLDQDYFFQTLVEGDEGTMSIRRDFQQRLQLNRSLDLPSSKKATTANFHNYRFKNGIGHGVLDHVRYKPYQK